MEQIPEYVHMTSGFSGADITQAWKTALLNVTREMMDGKSMDDVRSTVSLTLKT